MRILYLHQFFATRESSLGLIRSYEFSRRFIAQGHDVTVVTSASRLPEHFSERVFVRDDIEGIDVRSVRVAYSNYMSYPRRIASFAAFMVGATWVSLLAPRPDVILATSTPLTIGIPAWVASRVRRVPYVFEVRDLWPEAAIQMGALSSRGLLARVAKRLERFLYRGAVAIIALSPGMAEGVAGEGIAAEHIHMVPNSADLDLFSPGPKDVDVVARFALEGKTVVSYVGAIGPSNAVDAIVPQAAAELLARGRGDIVFLIVGDGKSLPHLRDLVEAGGLSNVILAGRMAKSEVPPITRTSDILMTLFADKPILATNSPNKFFDGLASGRPMIVNSPGWTKELVERHGCGVFVPPGDGVALADAIEALADDPDAMHAMGVRSRELAEAQFDRDALAGRVESVLGNAAADKRVRPR